jgi:hypothetical protein
MCIRDRLEEARDAARQAADLREERRLRREAGLPELTRSERLRERFSGGRERFSAGGRLADPRYLVALFLVVLVAAGGIAYGVVHGFGGDGGGGDGKGGKTAGVAKPGEIEVTVLNGTATPGLAARYGDKVERKGFKLGAVTNSSSSYAESVVMFKRGDAPEARRVAGALGISQVRLMTPDIASVSAGAPVSVVVGEDNASLAG